MPEAIEALEDARAIEPEWEELAVRAGVVPFLRPAWTLAWWDAFGSGSLAALTVRRQGRLAGVLPIWWRGKVARSPTNWHSDRHGAVAEDAAAKRALYGALFADRPRRVDLSFLSAEDDDLEMLRATAVGYQVLDRVMMSSPFVPVAGDWEAYWSGLSRNLRSTVRRCRNRLAERGKVEFAVEEGGEGLDATLEECYRLEATGWKGAEGTAIASRPETRRFYTETSRWAAQEGVLRLGLLRLDGRPVAFNLCLEAGGRHYLLKLGHEAELDRIGPGTVLTADMVQRAFELGLESYEFMGGPDPYKLRWAQGRREFFRAQAFAPTLAGRADRLVQTRGRALAKRVLRRGGG
jgi:CelD/BcsL family acetyltransferase involved in cellulose biosynthesis